MACGVEYWLVVERARWRAAAVAAAAAATPLPLLPPLLLWLSPLPGRLQGREGRGRRGWVEGEGPCCSLKLVRLAGACNKATDRPACSRRCPSRLPAKAKLRAGGSRARPGAASGALAGARRRGLQGLLQQQYGGLGSPLCRGLALHAARVACGHAGRQGGAMKGGSPLPYPSPTSSEHLHPPTCRTMPHQCRTEPPPPPPPLWNFTYVEDECLLAERGHRQHQGDAVAVGQRHAAPPPEPLAVAEGAVAGKVLRHARVRDKAVGTAHAGREQQGHRQAGRRPAKKGWHRGAAFQPSAARSRQHLSPSPPPVPPPAAWSPTSPRHAAG